MINIIDSLMGTGKSTWAINFINSHPENRYIVVTEYLDEATRFQENCPELNFVQPDGHYSKMSDFHRLMKEGANIATTHKLFTNLQITDSIREIISEYGYILIIDETIDVLDPIDIKQSDIKMLINDNHMAVKKDGFVEWTDRHYDGVWNNLRVKAESETLIMIEDQMLSWLFSSKTMKAFDAAYILTFNFTGSQMKNYMEVYDIPYTVYHIENNELVLGKQDLTEIKAKLRNLIRIYQGPMNKIGEEDRALSVTWYKKNETRKTAVLNNACNFFRHVRRVGVNDTLWTCFADALNKNKNNKKELTLNGYSSSFESCNVRAVNKWRDRHNLAYLINVFPNPEIVKWFKSNGSTVSINDYALNQLLQWIWRSAIRMNEPITLYIPSARMRNLLVEFLEIDEQALSA